MGAVKRAARAGVLACAVLLCGTAMARANEIWVAATAQQDLGGVGIGSNGIWPATPAGAVRLAWGVPEDLQTFTRARLVLIPHPPGGAATLTVYVCAAKSGDAAAAGCTGPFNHPFTGAANQLLEVDISAAIAPQVGLAGTNHLSIVAFTTPTTSTDHIVGLRFAYEAVTPAGVATLGGNTFTGTQIAPAFVGDGSGLTNLPVPAGAALLGANTFAGTQTIDGASLDLDPSTATSGNIMKNGVRFLHNAGSAGTNTFLGLAAGNFTTTGVANTGMGVNVLRLNASGSHNTAIGVGTLEFNTHGLLNSALGRDALTSNTTGNWNTAAGALALQKNTVGFGNTGVGIEALWENVEGTFNTAVGISTLITNLAGSLNTAIGKSALQMTTGSSNVGVGSDAGFNATSGSNNIYLGAGVIGEAGESNTMYLGRVGTQTRTFIAGVRGTAPANADALPVVIDSNGQLGTVSPTGIATLTANTFAGNQAVNGGNLDLDASTALAGNLTKDGTRFLHNFGASNVFLGTNAGNFTMSPEADGNTAVGASTLGNVTAGGGNTALGLNALFFNTTGNTNTATGASALLANTSGGGNTANGVLALGANTEGFENTASGHSALRLNTTGAGNTGVGVGALHSNLVGNTNTGMGRSALRNTTGHNNAALGFAAGQNATTGSNNIYIGTNVLGEAGESNTMYLGRVGTQTKTVIAGVRATSVLGGQMVLVDAAGRLGSGPVATGPNTVGSGEVIDNSLAPADVSFNYAASASKGGAASDLACAGCVGPSEVSFSFATLAGNTFTSTQTIDAGNIDLDPSTATTGSLLKNGTRFLHNVGVSSTFLGLNAGTLTTTGENNVGVGTGALGAVGTGSRNIAVGNGTLSALSVGQDNTSVGDGALASIVNAIGNTAVGSGALALVSGSTAGSNTAVGRGALGALTSGGGNTVIGSSAGSLLTTGTNNIYLDNGGPGAESLTIRIGDTQNRAFVAGIRGRTTANADAISVVIDSAGQLGTISSSRRFKEDIHDMGGASERLLRLRPVTFRYTQPFAGGTKPIQYGLIAEEVAEVFPELVARGADGRIETVQYQNLDALLLNELQKLSREVQALKAEIARLQQSRDDRK